jgi:hydrogenase expression/formation protein HypD
LKYLDEYRDGDLVKDILGKIEAITTKEWHLMEVCGGQTHSLIRYGLDKLLPEKIKLIHGPGCPVCVTPLKLIDQALNLAQADNIIFTSFGDMLRVPGSFSKTKDGPQANDLFSIKGKGGDVRIVYSPLDAVKLAQANPDREVVFFAIGFETTAPANAMAVKQAKAMNKTNIDGFLAAGHVCSVMGTKEYQPLSEKYHVPIVITGFEPVDLSLGILKVVTQLEQGEAKVENAYQRTVPAMGNTAAQRVIHEVFTICDRSWRGIGVIKHSGYTLRQKYQHYDALTKFPQLLKVTTTESKLCRSGDVLQGIIRPQECPAFGKECTPLTPLGATMVSSEGACAAYYKYGRLNKGL